jgi:hypothetical protein
MARSRSERRPLDQRYGTSEPSSRTLMALGCDHSTDGEKEPVGDLADGAFNLERGRGASSACRLQYTYLAYVCRGAPL